MLLFQKESRMMENKKPIILGADGRAVDKLPSAFMMLLSFRATIRDMSAKGFTVAGKSLVYEAKADAVILQVIFTNLILHKSAKVGIQAPLKWAEKFDRLTSKILTKYSSIWYKK